MKFSLRFPVVVDREQQAVNDDLLVGLNQLAQFFYAGTGAPTLTPPGPALYFRRDFGVNASVYSFDGTWKSVT